VGVSASMMSQIWMSFVGVVSGYNHQRCSMTEHSTDIVKTWYACPNKHGLWISGDTTKTKIIKESCKHCEKEVIFQIYGVEKHAFHRTTIEQIEVDL
jgi:hypothetical protein